MIAILSSTDRCNSPSPGKEIIINRLDELAALINRARSALLTSWREQVRQLPSARGLDIPTLNDHMPGLLDELIAALQAHSAQTIPEASKMETAPAHGLQRVQDA